MVTVDSSGRIPVQIADFGDEDIYLPSKTPIGILGDASGDTFEWHNTSPCEATLEEINVGRTVCSATENLMAKMDIGDGLNDDQREVLRNLLEKHQCIFCKGDDDIGHCNVVQHRIVTTDDQSIKVPHRRVPPHHWEEMREYIKKSLGNGIIRVIQCLCFTSSRGQEKGRRYTPMRRL